MITPCRFTLKLYCNIHFANHNLKWSDINKKPTQSSHNSRLLPGPRNDFTTCLLLQRSPCKLEIMLEISALRLSFYSGFFFSQFHWIEHSGSSEGVTALLPPQIPHSISSPADMLLFWATRWLCWPDGMLVSRIILPHRLGMVWSEISTASVLTHTMDTDYKSYISQNKYHAELLTKVLVKLFIDLKVPGMYLFIILYYHMF